METISGGSWIPNDSSGFQWIPLNSVVNSMEWKTKMAEAPAKWILLEFHGRLLETVGAGGRKEVDEGPACSGGATEVLAASRAHSTLSI